MNWTTPLPVGPYGRFMTTAFDERNIIGVPTAFQSLFGNPANGGLTFYSPDSQIVEIDILRGNERTALLIQRGTNSRPLTKQKNTDEQKYTTFSRQYPLMQEEGDINADQLNRRVAGEHPYQSVTKFDRLRELALNHHGEHVRRMLRAFELLCSLAIRTGKHPAIFGTTNQDLIYDFRRNPENTFSVVAGWNQSGATIFGDIDKMCGTVRKTGHVSIDLGICGGQAMDAMIKNETFQKLADNRRFELIEVSTNNPVPHKFARLVAGGLVPRGRLRTPKGYEIWIFTYNDIYTDEAGDAVNYMPEDQMLLGYSGARCDRYFGPSELLPQTASRATWYQEFFGFSPTMIPIPPNVNAQAGVVNPAMFFCDAYPGADYKTVSLRTQSAPIFVPTMTDGWGLLTDLIT